MQLTINGMQREVRDGMSVSDLLDAEGEPVGIVLVEVGGELIPIGQYQSRMLADGDVVEIILPAFGG